VPCPRISSRARTLRLGAREWWRRSRLSFDTSISKTVTAGDYPYSDFQDLHLAAWKSELKGLATYRPEQRDPARCFPSRRKWGGGAPPSPQAAADFVPSDRNRPHRDQEIPSRCDRVPALAGAPKLAGGNPAWTYMIEHPTASSRSFVGHVETPERAHPFEVWSERRGAAGGLGAVAKTLSWTCARTTGVAAREARDARKTPPTTLSTCRFPATCEAEEDAEHLSAVAQLVPAMRGDAPLPEEKHGPGARRDVQPEGAEDRGGRHHVVDRRRPQSGNARRFVLGLRKSPCPTASRAPTRCGYRANTARARPACARSCRSTCASSIGLDRYN